MYLVTDTNALLPLHLILYDDSSMENAWCWWTRNHLVLDTMLHQQLSLPPSFIVPKTEKRSIDMRMNI